MSSDPKTSHDPKRLIYFTGHPSHPRSAMVTQVCRDYETLTGLGHAECATRTLSNLYNLHVARGLLTTPHHRMEFASSMSGPHHYLGWLDPTQRLSIRFLPGEALPDVYELGPAAAFPLPPFPIPPVPDHLITQVTGYTWLTGATTDPAILRTFEGDHEGLYTDLVDTRSGEAASADSLFDTPGILAVPQHELAFPLLPGGLAMTLDLSPFHAQIVPNDGPFQFDQTLVSAHKHAQHKLRVVTYNFGDQ